MKKSLFLITILAACGDNIAPPDARPDRPFVSPPEPGGIKPGEPADAGVPEPDGIKPDASAPDGGTADPECEDKHIDLNGHEHKCTHDQP